MSDEHETLVDEALREYGRTMRALHQAGSAAWAELELSMAQLKALIALSEREPVAIGELAEALGVGQPAASVLVDKLVHLELVERYQDAADRRRTLVRRNETGRRLVARLLEGRRAHLRAWLERMDDADLAALSRGLSALTKNAPAPVQAGRSN